MGVNCNFRQVHMDFSVADYSGDVLACMPVFRCEEVETRVSSDPVVIETPPCSAPPAADVEDSLVDLMEDHWQRGCDTIVVTTHGHKWFRHAFNEIWKRITIGSSATQLAKEFLEEFDQVHEDPDVYVERKTSTFEEIVEVKDAEPKVQIRVKKSSRLVKGARSKFAVAIARVAYNKFGQREFNNANVLVTRKWIQKLIDEEYKDLRNCDKNIAIDRALFLSFIPTKSFTDMKLAFSTKLIRERLDPREETLFGRIFRLRPGVESPEVHLD